MTSLGKGHDVTDLRLIVLRRVSRNQEGSSLWYAECTAIWPHPFSTALE